VCVYIEREREREKERGKKETDRHTETEIYTAYGMWSVVFLISNLSRLSNFLRLLCHVSLSRDNTQ